MTLPIPPMPVPHPPPPPPAGHCSDDMGCSLLGICTAGTCKCDPGWVGPDCSRANLKPLNLSLGYNNGTDSTWGGRPIKDPATGRWSMLVCQMTNSCPLDYWTTNSLVVRAEAATAAGPFRFVETVYPLFHTNPQIIGPTPDGYYLLFTVGANVEPSVAIDCTKSPKPPPASEGAAAAGLISMGYSKGSPTGPWSEPRVVLTNNYNNSNVSASDWDCAISNPSPTLLPNGTVMLVFSSLPCTGPNYGKFGTSLGVAFAPHWNDTYTQSKVPIWLKKGPAWPEPSANGVGNCEDPFVWRSRRGYYHILSHSQGQLNVCGGGEGPGNSCGVHFFATSAEGPWRYSTTAVYSSAINVTDASGVANMVARQRPQLVFRDDGSPQYLVNAGSYITPMIPKAVDRTFVFEFE